MTWLSRLGAGTEHLTGVALPMALIGGKQGATLSPLTAAGISGADPQGAGAASGLVNVAHQLGGSLGLAILVTIFATAGATALTGHALLAQRVSVALTADRVMLAFALALVVVLIVRPQRAAAAVPRAAPTAAAGRSRLTTVVLPSQRSLR